MIAAVVFGAVWSRLEENAILLSVNIDFGVNCDIDAKDRGNAG